MSNICLYKKAVLISVLISILISCKPESKSDDLLIINHNEFILRDFCLSEIADTVIYIQYDPTVIMKPKRNKHTSEFIFLDSFVGLLKYDRNGNFLQRIGTIGQGPAEYNSTFYFGLNEDDEKVYVYSYPDMLLTYSFDGSFLDRVKIENFPRFFSLTGVWYMNNQLYLMSSVSFGAPASKPYYWWVINESGQLLDYKQDSTLIFHFNGVGGFGGTKDSFFDNSIIYWNHFNDTVFKLRDNVISPLCVWDKGKFRIKWESITDMDSFFSISKQGISPRLFLESRDYLFLRWEIALNDEYQKHHTVYDKKRHVFIDTDKPIINDLSGGTLERLEGYFEINGREYLEFMVEPYDLVEQLSASGKLDSEKLAETIDEGGNPVLVLVRLKENK